MLCRRALGFKGLRSSFLILAYNLESCYTFINRTPYCRVLSDLYRELQDTALVTTYKLTPWSTIFIQNLTVAQLVMKFSFMALEGSLPCSWKPATGPYPELFKSVSHSVSLRSVFKIVLPTATNLPKCFLLFIFSDRNVVSYKSYHLFTRNYYL
jgi:hypothetical protein